MSTVFYRDFADFARHCLRESKRECEVNELNPEFTNSFPIGLAGEGERPARHEVWFQLQYDV